MTTPIDRLGTALAGRYEIEREIGVGGMATVYLARDLRHDRLVALKLLRPELGAVIGAERFLAEIKLTANLQHPHILPLFDSGAVDGLLYYVMPYVEGVSVRERLDREKQLPLGEAIRIATEVASALDYAHRRGVIHRDIKPENILLHDGQALVADFGIALAVSTAGTRMTETGMSLGTPHYMSPEQAMGEREITARSDVYALGAVTYEMLVGEPPFTGPTAQSIVAKVVTEQPRPLIPKRHTIPQHVERAVLTALEKLPADRFGSAAEFSTALTSPGALPPVTDAERARRPLSSLRWRRPTLAAAGIATAAAIAGFLAGRVSATDKMPPPAVARFVVSTPAEHRIGGSGFTVVALSPDGTNLVYVGQSSRGLQLYRRRLDELTASPMAGTDGALAALYSPDGRWIVFPTGAGLKKIPAAGGAVVPINLGGLAPQAAAWIDDETLAATALDGRLFTLGSDGTTRLVAAPDTAKGEGALIVTDAIPATGSVLVLAASGGAVIGRAYVVDLKSGKRRLVVDQVVNSIAYNRGHLAWVDSEGTLFAAPFDLRGDRPAGAPITLAQRVRVSVGGSAQFAVSRNGTLVYVPQRPLDLLIVDREGRSQPAADLQRGFHSPRISPDGGRIAVDFTQQGSRDVWTLDLRERTLARLTFDNDGHDPVWDPTGSRIAYASARDGIIGMFVRNADGSGERDSLHVGTSGQTVGAYLPSGDQAVTIVTGRGGSFDLAFTSLTGDRTARPFLATPFNEAYPAISPDGRWLAYVSDESGQNEVYVRSLAGGGAKVLVSRDGGSEPVWSRDGQELFYRGFSPQGIPLVAAAVRTTPAFRVLSRTQLFDVSDYEPATPHANYDVGPDGRFVMVHQGRLSEMVIIQNWPEEVKRRGRAAR